MATTAHLTTELRPAPLTTEADWARIAEVAAGFLASTRRLTDADALVAALCWGRCPALTVRALNLVAESGATFAAAFYAVRQTERMIAEDARRGYVA